MSTTFYLNAECGCCQAGGSGGINTTYNLTPMCMEAGGLEEPLSKLLPDTSGAMSLPILAKIAANLRYDPDKYKEMNPHNGWGTYESLLSDIQTMTDWAARHPTYRWSCY